MSQTTDFETMYVAWCEYHMGEEYDAPLPPLPPDPDEVRAWWHHAHRPPLAERIAQACLDAWYGFSVGERARTDSAGGKDAVAAVQRVLDEEGER